MVHFEENYPATDKCDCHFFDKIIVKNFGSILKMLIQRTTLVDSDKF